MYPAVYDQTTHSPVTVFFYIQVKGILAVDPIPKPVQTISTGGFGQNRAKISTRLENLESRMDKIAEITGLTSC